MKTPSKIRHKESEIEGLSPKQATALRALLTAANRTQVAEQAGVTEVTLWRWLQDATFSGAYRKAQRDLHEQTQTKLQAIACEAVDALRGVLSDTNAPPASRVSAAKIVLDMCKDHFGQLDIAERLEALENAAAQKAKVTACR